ncbi:sensor histidine kinase [Nocardia sp. NPDC057227]|uniref:sensor histidine kinase n=1 Tax=Nocardia sp. NPDC057227 TaxID=3346056 RepID=UPI003628DE8C
MSASIVPLWVRAAAIPLGLLYVLVREPNSADPVLAVCSGALLVAGARWPLTAVAGQALLLVAAHELGQAAGGGVKVWAALTLAELALRARPQAQLAGAAILTAAYVALEFGDRTEGAVPLPYRLLVLVVLPLLTGGYIQALRRRAAEAERSAWLRAEAARRGERERIARDLHDIVAHHVSAILVRAGTARHVPDLDPAQTAEVLADVHATADSALRDLHGLLHLLRDPEPGGVGALLAGGGTTVPALLDEVIGQAARAGLRVSAVIDPALATVTGVRALVVHRTVQEAITNAVKHSGAGATVAVRAELDAAGAVAVAVRNDRRAAAPRPGGFGLTGMRERIDAVGGTVDYGPEESGWFVRATIPAPGR